MIEPIRKFLSRRLQQVPAALCLIAVAMQVSLPALHATHVASEHSALEASGAVASLAAATDHAGGEGRHDSSTCSQCRLVSQLKSLAPLSVITHAPAVAGGWIATASVSNPRSHAGRDSSSPRAPPFLA